MERFKDSIDTNKLAPKCERNHICLENQDAVLCNVDYCVNNKVLFVKNKGINFNCPYINNFGYSHFCTCPIRMLIYQALKKNKN